MGAVSGSALAAIVFAKLISPIFKRWEKSITNVQWNAIIEKIDVVKNNR